LASFTAAAGSVSILTSMKCPWLWFLVSLSFLGQRVFIFRAAEREDAEGVRARLQYGDIWYLCP
jgi:hypothetical protein